MSKLSFFFTTLIAAIPAAFLGYLCVAAFLFHSDSLPPILMGVAGITLLLCVLVVVMPVYVLLQSSGRTKTAEDKTADESESDASDVEDTAEDDLLAEDESAADDAVMDEEEDIFVEEDDEHFDERS